MGKGRALRSRTEAVREKTGRQEQAAGAPRVAPLLGPQVLAILLAQAQAPPQGQGQGSPSLSVWGRARTSGTYLLGQTARKQAGPGVEGKAEGWDAPKNRSDRNRGSGKGCTGARATAREQAEGRGERGRKPVTSTWGGAKASPCPPCSWPGFNLSQGMFSLLEWS